MSINDIFWMFFMFTALQPVLRQRMLEIGRYCRGPAFLVLPEPRHRMPPPAAHIASIERATEARHGDRHRQ